MNSSSTFLMAKWNKSKVIWKKAKSLLPVHTIPCFYSLGGRSNLYLHVLAKEFNLQIFPSYQSPPMLNMCRWTPQAYLPSGM